MTLSAFVLSGWAMPQAVFLPVQQRCKLQALALPGISSWSGIFEDRQITWTDLVSALDRQLPDKQIVLAGWSLGGLIATCYAALHPQRVKHLLLIGCNPCFVACNTWSEAMSQSLFDTFITGVQSNITVTLKKFMFLCSQGSKDKRSMFRDLQQLMTAQSINTTLLIQLLSMLSDDLRPVLAKVQCPVTHLLGKQDALVPHSINKWIKQQYPQHQVQLIDGGHLFFREQPETIARIFNKL